MPKSREKPTLARALNRRLRKYSFGSGIVLSTLFGVGSAAALFYIQDRHQDALLQAVRQNITYLAQNSDYREIERVMSSFLDSIPGASALLVRDGVIQMSLPDMQRNLLPYRAVRTHSLAGVVLGDDWGLYSVVSLQDPFSHADFGSLILSVPAMGPMREALLSLLVSFASVWLLLMYWRRLTRRTLSESLRPLQQLHVDLEAIGRGNAPTRGPDDYEIKELSDISTLVEKQYRDVIALTKTAADAEGDRRVKEGVRSLLHDLLNPLQASSCLAQARIMFPGDEDIRAEFEEKWPALDRQIKDLLKAARHMEVERPNMRVKSLLDTVAEGARLGAVKNPSSLKIRELASDEVSSWGVAHDPVLLGRAVANLVRNSVEEGATEVEVWCARKPFSIHIRDNGPGIPQEKVSQLFEGRLKSHKPEGSGIGFPTALRLVRLHRGRILLETVAAAGGRGAHFRIDLEALEDVV